VDCWSGNIFFVCQETQVFNSNQLKHRQGNKNVPTKKMTMLSWNIEGLKSVTEISKGIFQTYDVVVLVENFLAEEWHSNNHYAVHVLADKGTSKGRPKGGITYLLKGHLFSILSTTQD
jgi:hypothetical protein